MLGHERSLLKNRRFSLFVSVDTRPIFNLFLDKVFQTKSKETCEVKLITIGDSPMHVLFTGISTENQMQCNITLVDITRNKQLEEKLLFINKAVESAGDAIGISDAQGRHIYQNKALSDIFGYATAEELQAAGGGAAVVKDPEVAKDMFENIMRGKPWSGELEMVTKSGNIFPAYERADAITNSEGDIVGLIGVIQDITGRKQVEETLRSISEFNQSLLKTIPFGMDIVDENGNILFLSDTLKQHFGEDALGKKCWNLYRDDNKQCSECPLHSGINVGETKTYETNGVLGGKTFEIYHTGMIFNGQKAMLEAFINITERKHYEQDIIIAKEHAEESDRLKSAFLANMSHEIRTPMNGILGFAGLLKEPDLTGEEQQKYIRIIEKSGARMLNIINDIVDISKIEAGLMEVDLNESNINDQVEYIYTFFKPEVENKGLGLFFKNSLPAKEAIIETDPEKLYAILTNLVKNAIKYTREGSIDFGYEKKGEYLEFFVKDTGIGIAGNRQEAIFERFIQADIEDTKAQQGAGLGLAITKAYVEMLGGKIRVESDEGIGSIFYFTIPYNVEKHSKIITANVGSAKDIEVQIKNLKILIVEDDETSDFLITSMLKKNDHEVLHVKTGVESVEACRNNPDIDLILMDIRMPGMGGYEATRQIRGFNKDVIIIAQTAYGLSGDRQKAIDAGCNEYLSKPIDKNELMRLMQKYFKK